MRKVLVKNSTEHIGFIGDEEVDIYPRKCSKTNRGIYSGYVVGNTEYLDELHDDLLDDMLKELSYEDRDNAFQEDAYYYTDWYDWQYEEGDVVYTLEGEELEVTFK